MEETHVAITGNSSAVEAPRDDGQEDTEMVDLDGPENFSTRAIQARTVHQVEKTKTTKQCDPETEIAKALYDPETEIAKDLRQCWVDVAEVYSPPRVTSMVEKMGLAT